MFHPKDEGKALLPWELLGLSPHPLDETPTTATVRMPQHEDTASPMGQKTASVKKTNTQAVIATAPPGAPLANPTFAETITSFQATQHAWNDALATDLRLDLTASAHLVNGSLKTSLALQGRDGNTLPSLHRTETPTSALPLGKTDLSNTHH